MVSIIPGMDSRAPERTESSSGFLAAPSFLPTSFSICATEVFTSLARDLGYCRPLS